MKKCDHFRELILTDYIDGELDPKAASSMEGHLLECADCRAFLKEVKEKTALPFQKASLQPVPDELWDSIKQNIRHEEQAPDLIGSLIDKLKEVFILPKLVPILASLVIMLLVGSVTLDKIQIQQAQARDQGEYLISLLTSSDTSAGSDNNDPGTPIEHYFL